MDIDSLGHEHGRLGLYQNHNNSAFDEGPARKRECLLGLVGRSDVLTFCRAAYRFRESAVLREPVDAIETALHVQHAILLQRGKLYTKVYVQL
jgi:hypothetical protein